MNVDKIQQLIRLVEQSDIESLEICPFLRTAIKISKRRSAEHNGSAPTESPQLVPVNTAPSVPVTPPPPNEDLIEVTAPMVGTFYRAPSPGSPSFVEVGQAIKPGDTLCIIEAMKLMNEIEAELGGTIAKILVEDAQPVEFGQILFLLKPSA